MSFLLLTEFISTRNLCFALHFHNAQTMHWQQIIAEIRGVWGRFRRVRARFSPQGSPHQRAGMAPGPTSTALTLARAERLRATPGPTLLICPVASSSKTTTVQSNGGLRRMNNYMENVKGSFLCPVLLTRASFPLARTIFPLAKPTSAIGKYKYCSLHFKKKPQRLLPKAIQNLRTD